jgi:hypothetical protein
MGRVNWTEQETLSAFLDYRWPQDGAHWVSCLIALLRDARVVTGRDVATGEVEPDKVELAGRWLGAVGYMTLFDQIGSAYRRADVAELSGQAFMKAFQYFAPEVNEAERDALYALRCSFVHDYSLVNVPKQGRQEVRDRRTHHFILTAEDDAGPIVKLPPERWDGDLDHCRIRNATWINLRLLGNLAEEVFKRIVVLHETGDLIIALSGGLTELQRRYAMTIRPIEFVDP